MQVYLTSCCLLNTTTAVNSLDRKWTEVREGKLAFQEREGSARMRRGGEKRNVFTKQAAGTVVESEDLVLVGQLLSRSRHVRGGVCGSAEPPQQATHKLVLKARTIVPPPFTPPRLHTTRPTRNLRGTTSLTAARISARRT